MRNITIKSFVLIVLSCFTRIVFAQTIQAFDKTNLQGISSVQVFNGENPDLKVLTGTGGKADVSSLKKEGEWTIRHPFYTSQKMSYERLVSLNFKVYLIEKLNDLDEVVVSASRFEEKKADVAQKVQLIRNSQLQQMNQSSTADVLAQSGNVMVQKSQQGGGSPIIRGFETNRVLIVIDGVRMNNAIYRGGHLQNVITLDNSMMDKVEIAFGPSSAVYGSDALGGVMHFHSKSPVLATTTKTLVKANAYARYFSAANGYAAHADVSVSNKKLGSITSFTLSQFGDLTQGSKRSSKYPDFGKRNWYQGRINGKDTVMRNPNPNKQVGSEYEQIDLLQKILFQSSANVKHTLNVQFSTTKDVPRYDRLTEMNGTSPKFAEWYYGPQRRFFASYMLELSKEMKLYDKSRLVLAYQNIEESRIDRRFNSVNRNHRIETLNILSANLDFEKDVNRHEIRYGLEAYTNQVNSKAFRQNIQTQTNSPLDTRYPDGGSNMNGLAVYATHTIELGKKNGKFILSNGIRISYISLNAQFRDQSYFPFPFSDISQRNANVTGNLGFVYNPTTDWRITVNASTGFRTPNVDDLTKVFESVPGSLVVPNPKLRSEYSYNGEISVSKTFNERITISFLGYYTLLNNVINVQKAQFNGQDSIIYDGVLSQVIAPTNSGKAYIYGTELAIKGEIFKNLSVFATLNYTYGRIKTDSTEYPLDHIAPLFGRIGFTFSMKKFKAELFANYSGAKKVKDYNLIGEDNFASATPDGMPTWYTLNLRLNYQICKSIGLQLACENILDQNYRVFASNISAPGRNFIVTLRFGF